MSPTISCIFHNWDRMYHINNGSGGGVKELKELMGDVGGRKGRGGGRLRGRELKNVVFL